MRSDRRWLCGASIESTTDAGSALNGSNEIRGFILESNSADTDSSGNEGVKLDASDEVLALVLHMGEAYRDDVNTAAMRAILTERYFSGPLLAGVQRLKAAVASTRPFSCAGLAYIDLCAGDAEIATPARLRPWDHAAGALMHLEAGGHNALADGTAYGPHIDRGLFIVTPDGASWQAVQELMTG